MTQLWHRPFTITIIIIKVKLAWPEATWLYNTSRQQASDSAKESFFTILGKIFGVWRNCSTSGVKQRVQQLVVNSTNSASGIIKCFGEGNFPFLKTDLPVSSFVNIRPAVTVKQQQQQHQQEYQKHGALTFVDNPSFPVWVPLRSSSSSLPVSPTKKKKSPLCLSDFMKVIPLFQECGDPSFSRT